MAQLTTDITSRHWSLSITDQGEVVQDLQDIAQCIVIILSTNKGSDPFRPNFGFNLGELLDKPVNYVIPNGKLGILNALEEYEPRVTVDKIEHTLETSHVTFIVYCTTNLGSFVISVPISATALGAFSSAFSSAFN